MLKILLVGMIIFFVVWLILCQNPKIWKTVTEKIESTGNKKLMLVLFLGMILAQGWMVFNRELPFIADEVYSLSGASFFAGYDWSSYMSLHKFYNFGYTMLLAPIYKVFSNPVAIYRTMLFVNVIVRAVIALIAYYVAYNKFHCNKVTSLAIAIVSACNSLVLFFGGFLYNELPLALLTWVILWLLLEIPEKMGKKRILLSALLGMVSAYGYIVHSRCLILYVSLGLLIMMFFLVYKKWVVQPVSFATAFGICIYFEKQLLQYVQKNLYLKGVEVVMPNSVEHMVTGTQRFEALKSLAGIKKLIVQFFSLAGSMTIETGGLVTVVSVACLYFIWKNFKKMRKGEVNKKLFILFLFSFVSLWSMVLCIALVGAHNGQPRFLVYSRYFSPFIGSFLLLGLYLLKMHKELKFKWIAIWSWVLNIIVVLVYVFYSFPILDRKSMRSNSTLYLFIPFARYKKQLIFTKNVFMIALFLLVVFTVILLFLYKRKQFVAFCMVTILFSVALFWRTEEKQCKPAAERKYNACDATYALLEEETIFSDKNIYCAGTEMYRKGVLIAAYDKDIVYNLQDVQVNEDTVLLSNTVDTFEEYRPSYVFQLDSNEWIGIWDEELKSVLEKRYQSHSRVEGN
ncbi:MAG: hypothetical protein K2K56_11490 [Lachnospiraceae bacterium]|nr:hypothetical protein [Lachnospiraceae bacterium]